MKGIVFRPFKEIDREECLNLYNLIHPEKMSEELWLWRLEGSPMGNAMIETAWDKNRIAGFYMVIPKLMHIQGKILPGALSDIAVTHPDYRYRGIFGELGARLYERASREGIRIIYGFPTDHNVHGFKGKLKWNIIKKGRPLYCWGCGIDPTVKGFKMVRADVIGEEFDRLWQMLQKGIYSNRTVVVRNSKYLRWRFLMQPGKDYDIWSSMDSDGSPCGYAAVSKLSGKNEECMEIVDIAATSPLSFRYMIGYLKEKYGNNTVRLIIPEVSPFYEISRGIGFREGGKHYYFGYKTLTGGSNMKDEWYYSISDGC